MSYNMWNVIKVIMSWIIQDIMNITMSPILVTFKVSSRDTTLAAVTA